MQTPNDARLEKKLTLYLFVAVFIIFSIYSFALVPLNVKSYTDIAFMIPVLIDLLPAVTYLTEIAGMLIMYAFILFAAYRFGIKTVKLYVMLFVVMILYRHLTSTAMIYVMNGSFPDASDLIFDLTYRIALPSLYIYAIMALILLIVYLVFRKAGALIKNKNAASVKTSDAASDGKRFFYPFIKLFSKENPLQKSALWIAVIFALNKLSSQILTDIDIGAPTDTADLLWMIAAYISCFLLGFASYLFLLFILIQLDIRDIKMKYENK